MPVPIRIFVFFAALITSCCYALWRGGAPERWTATMMAMAAIGTAALPRSQFAGVEVGQLVIDAGLLAALVALSARADRFWPSWMAALQLIAVTAHGVRSYDAAVLPEVYNQGIGKIAYPIIIILVWGTRRHVERVSQRGPEEGWSRLKWR